jgi:hypothetical protein
LINSFERLKNALSGLIFTFKFHKHFDEKIKIMKDISSAMILLAVIFSLIIGLIIFDSKMVGYF